MLRKLLLAVALLAGALPASAATLISRTSGSLTSASTWGTVDATSLLDSEAASTALTTSYVQSASFTPGAITIDGFAVKLANRTGTTGTMTCELYNSTLAAAVTATTVTINTADLPAASQSLGGSWVTLGFASTLLLAANDYKVECKTSSAAQVSIYRNATAGNWSRALRTTTTAAPGAGDNMIVAGEHTGAGTGSDFTVTMDSEAATDYGTGVTIATGAPAALSIGSRGTLTWGTTASKTYILQLSGWLEIGAGGLMNMGTNGTPMPSSSTATLQFDCAADSDFGVLVKSAGSLEMHGTAKTPWTLLTTDEAAASTVIGVADTTGWAAGDELVFPSTTATYTQHEVKAISTVDSATQVTLTAGLTNAHTGTGLAIGEAGNLTRNVVIKSVSTTAMAFVATDNSVIGEVDIDYSLFRYLGTATAARMGVALQGDNGSGTQNFAYNVIRDADGRNFNLVAGSQAITFDHNVIYEGGQVIAATGPLFDLPTTGSSTITNNLFVASGGSTSCVHLVDAGVTFTGNVVASCEIASSNAVYYAASGPIALGTFSGNSFHSNRNVGLYFDYGGSGTMLSNRSWRNGAHGIEILNTHGTLVLDDWDIYGNVTAGIELSRQGDLEINNSTIAGEASYPQANGIRFNAVATVPTTYQIRGYDTTFGSGASLTTHGTADINLSDSESHPHVVFTNTTMASGTEVSGMSTVSGDSYIACQRCDTTAGNHWIEKGPGRVARDTTFDSDSSGESARMTPRSASVKLRQIVGTAPVVSGGTVTATWSVRESEVGDGTAYNGARAILYVLRNTALGIASDTALDTATAASDGAFEALSGTTATVTDAGVLEFAIDVDGTTGWVNVDAGSAANMTWNLNEWADGQPARLGTASAGGSGGIMGGGDLRGGITQ